jgi:hypothetical protein
MDSFFIVQLTLFFEAMRFESISRPSAVTSRAPAARK